MKKTISIAIAAAVTGFTLIPLPALAVNLTFQGSDEEALLKSQTPINQLLRVEGRAGAPGGADYELGIGLNGAQADLTGQQQLTWIDEQVYNWNLNWNPTTNTGTFSVDGIAGDISYTFDGSTGPDKFNAFSILAKSRTETGKVDPNTQIEVSVDQIAINDGNGLQNITVVDNSSGTAVPVSDPLSVQATSPNANGQTLNKRFYFLENLVDEITRITGRFTMNWDRDNGATNPQENSARSRVDFQITLFDPPVSPSQSQSVPEPSSTMAILAFAATGAFFTSKGKKLKNKQASKKS